MSVLNPHQFGDNTLRYCKHHKPGLSMAKKAFALTEKIKAINKGSVTPTGLAKGQEKPTPQKVKDTNVPGLAYGSGGKIRPQRG